MTSLYESSIRSLPLISRGKVRDIYAVGEDKLLLITSDRLSAFDVVLPDPIPHKGTVLTAVSDFWFKKLAHIIPNHLTDIDPASVVAADEIDQVKNRAIVVKRLFPLPIEAVVRGYVIGSGWKDYQQNGSICGIALPLGLKLAAKLKEPIFTPATKAAVGDHDENISFEVAEKLCDNTLKTVLSGTGKTGAAACSEAKTAALRLYIEAAAFAATKGILIADTKFEFGLDKNGTLHLIDEALTPDSSRFWSASTYEEGSNPPSYDKQYVRDYLETLNWNKKAPAPKLPAQVIEKTSEKYREAALHLTGKTC